MSIPLIALSDTHLGEPTSLLEFAEGRTRLSEALRKLVSDHSDDGTVDEVVLIGDIPDRTLASHAQIQKSTRALIELLTSSLKPKRIVYVPGNHDHTLWSRMVDASGSLAHPQTRCTDADGWLLLKAGTYPIDDMDSPGAGSAEGRKQLLSLFVDPQARCPFDFVVANPVYVRTYAERPGSYVFAHGTHFRADVAAPKGLLDLLTKTLIDEILVQHPVQSVAAELIKQPTLSALEAAVTPFVDTLWPSAEAAENSKADRLWYILCVLSRKFLHKRILTEHGDAACYLKDATQHKKRISQLDPDRGSLKRFRKVFLPQLRRFLADSQIPSDPMTFVYGDTHEGGWAQIQSENITAYNTGAWVVHGKQHHPPCHIFVIPPRGDEFLFDVSFEKEFLPSGESLLAHAEKDVEARKARAEAAMPALARIAAHLPDHD